MKPKHFSDFAKEERLIEGDKTRIDSILNQEILITGYKIRKSKYKENNSEQYLTVQFEFDGIKKIFFSGSNVLLDQINKYGHEIPFVTTIKKIDKYYTFS